MTFKCAKRFLKSFDVSGKKGDFGQMVMTALRLKKDDEMGIKKLLL